MFLVKTFTTYSLFVMSSSFYKIRLVLAVAATGFADRRSQLPLGDPQ
ncbi:MAG: hypothetical protein J7L57_00650 [Deltaproteobacteria bacterium]|nr:hypothetical protein [Candidatus Tharpella sp.]